MRAKGQGNRVKGHNFKFLHPPKQDVVLKVLIENKVFYISKRALRAGTACNKGLK